jgi:hypothetical protein
MNERDQKLALKCRLIAEHTGGIYADSLQAFADLIRADEREACVLDIQMCIPRTKPDTEEMIRMKNAIRRIKARGAK